MRKIRFRSSFNLTTLLKKVNAVPYGFFYRKIKNRATYRSTLPCVKKVLRLHFLRSIYIAALQQRTTMTKPDILGILEFGCNEDGKIT